MTFAQQHACFDRWMRDHVAILHRVTRAFAEESDRLDLLQEVTLAIWNAIPNFRSEASPATYIYRVSHNAAMTWKRAQRNYRKHLDRLEIFASTEPLPNDSTEERRQLEQLYAAIRLLPPIDRSLILLWLDGVSYRDMANLHGLSESNVGVRLNRIKQHLAENINETVQS